MPHSGRTYHVRHSALVLSILAFICCQLTAAPAAAQEVVVESADPPSAEQGTINLDVLIGGSGFKKGAMAKFLVSGSDTDTGGVTVNTTTFKNSGLLIANITVAENASISKFDIQVTSNGRRGKGIELFSVQQKGSGSGGSHSCETPLSITFRDAPNPDSPGIEYRDRLRSDGGGPYVDDTSGESQQGTTARIGCDGGFYFAFQRFVVFEFFEPIAPNTTALFLAAPGNLEITFDLPGGLNDLPVDVSTVTSKVQFNVVDSSTNTRYFLGFWPDNQNDLYPGTTTITATRVAADTWIIEAAPGDIAKLLKSPARGKLRREEVGDYHAPFQMILVALPK